MALDPNIVLDTIKENHAQNVWSDKIQTAILGVIGTAFLGVCTWLIAFFRRVGKMEAQLEAQAKELAEAKDEIEENKKIFEDALAESRASRERINESIRNLHEENSKTRELLAAQPTKQDIIEMERRLYNAIYRAPPADFFDTGKPR